MSRIFFVFILVVLTGTILYVAVPWLLTLLQIILNVTLFSSIIIIGIVLMLVLRIYHYYKYVTRCSKAERRRVGGLELVVCVNGSVNAWFNGRDIIIGNKLSEILSPVELEAVYYHEEGHKKFRYMPPISALILALWWLLMVVVFVIDLLQRLGLFKVSEDLVLISVSYSILVGGLLALTIMLWMWFGEHEADLYSARKVGSQYLMSALIKLYIYGFLDESGFLWEKAGLNVGLNVLKASSIVQEPGMREIFVMLVKGSLLSFAIPLDVLRKRMPQTHPPLSLRLYMLSRIS
jgi:Zn-dependent protease with chaperone function